MTSPKNKTGHFVLYWLVSSDFGQNGHKCFLVFWIAEQKNILLILKFKGIWYRVFYLLKIIPSRKMNKKYNKGSKNA